MAHNVVVRGHEFLQRRIDIVEIDIGDEAIDSGIDAARLVAMKEATRRNQSR